jgi:hypothetical protein
VHDPTGSERYEIKEREMRTKISKKLIRMKGVIFLNRKFTLSFLKIVRNLIFFKMDKLK